MTYKIELSTEIDELGKMMHVVKVLDREYPMDIIRVCFMIYMGFNDFRYYVDDNFYPIDGYGLFSRKICFGSLKNAVEFKNWLEPLLVMGILVRGS